MLMLIKISVNGENKSYWEDFDQLATDLTKDNLVTTTAAANLASFYKSDTPKMMPSNNEIAYMKSLSKRNGVKGKGSPAKTRQYNYRPVGDLKTQNEIRTTVANIVMDKHDNFSDFDEKLFKEIRKSSNKINEKVNNQKDKVFNDIRVPFKEQNECVIQVNKSLSQDLHISRSSKALKGQKNARANIIEEDDDTLNLSPIHRSENSFNENSPGINRKARTETLRNFDRDSIATSTVPPLFKSSYQVTRKRKYILKDAASSINTNEQPISKLAKSRYSFSEKIIRPKKEVHTFKDLFQYENFKEILNPVKEVTEPDYAENNTLQNVDKRSSIQGELLKNKFYLPKPDETMSMYNTTYHEAANNHNLAENEMRKSKIRRYGKNKFNNTNE